MSRTPTPIVRRWPPSRSGGARPSRTQATVSRKRQNEAESPLDQGQPTYHRPEMPNKTLARSRSSVASFGNGTPARPLQCLSQRSKIRNSILARVLDDEQSDGKVISIVGAGMTVEGDCETDGSLRIEGTIRGDVRAGKSVAIGKDGLLEGGIYTQDAVIAGRVLGAVYAESYLELQATSEISGEIQARRMHVEDGAALQGQVTVGEGAVTSARKPGQALSGKVGKAQASDDGTQGRSSLRGVK